MAPRTASVEQRFTADYAHTFAVYQMMKRAEPALFDPAGEAIMARMVYDAYREDLRAAGLSENEIPRDDNNALADLHRLSRIQGRFGIRSAEQFLGDVRDRYAGWINFNRALEPQRVDYDDYRIAPRPRQRQSNARPEPPPHAALTIQMMADAMAEVERITGAIRELTVFPFGYHRHEAEALLKAWLSPEQLEQYAKDGTFVVIGSDTGKRYTISNKARSYNVTAEDAAYCFGPQDVPLADVILAQKIALETMEGEALKVANRRDAAGIHPAMDFQEFHHGSIRERWGRYDGIRIYDGAAWIDPACHS